MSITGNEIRREDIAMASLYEDPHFTFRFAEDRIIPRFHLEGAEEGRAVSVFEIEPRKNERLRQIASATVGVDGWVELEQPIVVRAGGAFIAVVDELAPSRSEVGLTSIDYQRESTLAPHEFIDLLVRSTLAERRPIHEPDTIRAMLENADVILTARTGGRLIGVARAITDFAYCTYLSDLAVDEMHQRRGIGRELIRRTHEAAGLSTTLILLSAPKAVEYYPHIGMTRHESCWIKARAGGVRS